MEAETPASAGCQAVDKPLQFGLQAMLGTIVVLCLLLAYLRSFGVATIGRCGLLMAIAIVMGGIVGAVSRRTVDATFWSVIGVVFGYLAVLNAYVSHWSGPHVWPLVGAITGATTAIPGPGKPVRRMAIGVLTAASLITVYLVAVFGLELRLAAELFCAVLAGGILGLGIELAYWLEERISIPRHLLAIGLVGLAIIGHWIAPKLIPGW